LLNLTPLEFTQYPCHLLEILFNFSREEVPVLRKMQYLFVLALLSSLALADQITLKNGDRLTGKVVKSDGKILVLHTDAAGDVTIQFDAIQQITTDADLHVGLKDGKTVVGPVTTRDGKLEVTTKSGGNVEASAGDVTVMRNDAEQTTYDKSLHPGLLHGWNGGFNVGFALARGNNQTENLSLAFNATHPTLNDKITMYAGSVYTNNDAPGATPGTIADLAEGGIRYDRNINPRIFAFVGADFMADALQGLNLRSVGTVGFGLHAIKSDKTTLDLLGGINFTDENYTETNPTPPPATMKLIHNFGALTLGEELMHKFGDSTVLVQKFYMYPDLTDRGEYRGTFDLGTVTKISKWLGWQNQISDIYVTNPPEGKKQNDIIFTTGLNVSFTHY
jgi:putative salt-induced outer membrane protein YdiY